MPARPGGRPAQGHGPPRGTATLGGHVLQRAHWQGWRVHSAVSHPFPIPCSWTITGIFSNPGSGAQSSPSLWFLHHSTQSLPGNTSREVGPALFLCFCLPALPSETPADPLIGPGPHVAGTGSRAAAPDFEVVPGPDPAAQGLRICAGPTGRTRVTASLSVPTPSLS